MGSHQTGKTKIKIGHEGSFPCRRPLFKPFRELVLRCFSTVQYEDDMWSFLLRYLNVYGWKASKDRERGEEKKHCQIGKVRTAHIDTKIDKLIQKFYKLTMTCEYCSAQFLQVLLIFCGTVKLNWTSELVKNIFNEYQGNHDIMDIIDSL
jgi:hypothetical protein